MQFLKTITVQNIILETGTDDLSQIEIEIIKTHLGFLEVDRSKHIFTRLAYTHTHSQIHTHTHEMHLRGGWCRRA